MTYFLLLLAALAVAAAGWLVRRRWVVLGQVIILAGCAGCVAAIVWQVRQSFFPPEAKLPNRAHSVVGFFFANQVLADIAGQRGTIVLVFPPANVLDAATAQSYANGLRPPLLRGHPELQAEIVRLEAPAKAPKTAVIPLAGFKQAMGKFPGALAFVVYAAVPADIGDLFDPEQKSPPPLYLFDPAASTRWVGALKQGRLRTVIVPRPGADFAANSGIAGSPGEIFSRLYLMATPATADQVAAQLGVK